VHVFLLNPERINFPQTKQGISILCDIP